MLSAAAFILVAIVLARWRFRLGAHEGDLAGR